MAYRDAQRSGAYIMRTTSPASTVIQKYLLVIYKGEHVQEARVSEKHVYCFLYTSRR